MNIKLITTCTFIAIIIGIIVYAIQHEWIIMHIAQPYLVVASPSIKNKKKVTFYYWHHNRWHTETQELIWSDFQTSKSATSANIATVVSHWLSLIDTDHILPKKVILQSAALSPNRQEIYLSFDRNLLPKEWSIYHKWMFIEGLLKTIRSNGISIHAVHFLVHHQPIFDSHLDFSDPWPITGFAES